MAGDTRANEVNAALYIRLHSLESVSHQSR
jgi:hypothetical protein